MAKVTIKGVFPTYKTLADGTRKAYWYHRPTGTRLPGEKGSPEFLAAYVEAERIAPRETNNTAFLIRDYLLSPKFEKKAARTKAEYRRMLAILEAEFGTLPVKALESPKVRAVFLDYQEEVGRDREREADTPPTIASSSLAPAMPVWLPCAAGPIRGGNSSKR